MVLTKIVCSKCSNTTENFANNDRLQKKHVKLDCINEDSVNGPRQTLLNSFALYRSHDQKIIERPGRKFYEKK